MLGRTKTLWIGTEHDLPEVDQEEIFPEIGAFLPVRQYCTNVRSVMANKVVVRSVVDTWALQGELCATASDFHAV